MAGIRLKKVKELGMKIFEDTFDIIIRELEEDASLVI